MKKLNLLTLMLYHVRCKVLPNDLFSTFFLNYEISTMKNTTAILAGKKKKEKVNLYKEEWLKISI